MVKRSCELCTATARIHCEPDSASLCWNCDAEVHSANFLVARHSRNLLCQVCQSPTPWSASGSVLVAAGAFCLRCADGGIHGNVDDAEADVMENRGESYSPPPPPMSSESYSSTSTDAYSDEEYAITRLHI